MKLSARRQAEFQSIVWSYYDQHGRDMPWRQDTLLYSVLVSEMMLQQTQVSRVIPKYQEFMQRFPTILSLAHASLADVIVAWQGLGYNRRAKYLHDAACMIVRDGEPKTDEELVRLPGVGANTAGAIGAYVYNLPTVFVETNIRTVYIHHFFTNQTEVSDRDIRSCVQQTLDQQNPREWYWALMDYGAHLKQTNARLVQSKHYVKQTPLRGSNREMRGMVVRYLSNQESVSSSVLRRHFDDPRFEIALTGLQRDGLISVYDERVSLTVSPESS